jgi:hypothetical protein
MNTDLTILGGKWADLGDCRERRWPSKIGEKRPISVTISSWIGTSPGARHYYVEVKEENNMWWDPNENCWRELWDDQEKKGYILEKASVMTEEEAIKLAIFFIKLIHPTDYKDQEIHWLMIDNPTKGRDDW